MIALMGYYGGIRKGPSHFRLVLSYALIMRSVRQVLRFRLVRYRIF